MTEASFYLLSSQSVKERYLFACRLIEKAYRNNRFCYVMTDTPEQSQIIDELLWTFRAGSFIPHQIYTGDEPAFKNTVLIGSLDAPESWQKTLINLSSRCPHDFHEADRSLEILDDSAETKESGRRRYRQYHQSGIIMSTHKIN